MPKLKVLSGKDVVKIFNQLGFSVFAQRGSHVKLRRTLNGNNHQTLTVPYHNELDKGTVKAIYNQALKYVSEAELKAHFYG